MTTRSCPWQYEWKRPQWQSPIDTIEEGGEQGIRRSSLGDLLCCTSAQVALDEFQANGVAATSSRGDNVKEDSAFVLTVSLFSSSNNQVVGDVLLLELMSHESKATGASERNTHAALKRIKTRALRWPGAVLSEKSPQSETKETTSEHDSVGDEDSEKTARPWYSHLFRKQTTRETESQPDGLVSIALCRRPPPSLSNDTATVDALDVVSLMSLGMFAPSTPSLQLSCTEKEDIASNDISSRKQHDTDTPPSTKTDLVLVCLTIGGNVHMYNVPPLFAPASSIDMEDDMVGGLASLFLGQDVYQQVLQSILPLSKPAASVALSIPINKKRDLATLQKSASLPNMAQEALHTNEDEEKDQLDDDDSHIVEALSWWDGSVWDPTIEASSSIYRTVSNVPNMCVSAFDYVAVAGVGIRRRRKRRKSVKEVNNPPSAEEKPQEVPEATTPRAEDFTREEKVEEKGDNSNTDWWSDSGASGAPKTQESWTEASPLALKSQGTSDSNWANEADTEKDAAASFQEWDKDVSSSTSSLRRKSKSKWIEYNESGGFVTFISLTHNSEVRTVYLPFAPKHVSPLVWGGMSFVVILGEDESAIAIRIDSSPVLTTVCGEAPSLTSLHETKTKGRTSNVSEDDDLTSTSERDLDGSSVTRGNSLCSVRRFQLIPILLPTREGEEKPSASLISPIAVSSASTAPPCIAMLYSSCADEKDTLIQGDVLVALHSLQSLDFVIASEAFPRRRSSSGRHGQFGSHVYGPGDLALSIQTAHHPGHLARVPFRNEPEISSLWCHIGQGWSLFGAHQEIYYICWEGATESDCAFVTEIHSSERHVGDAKTSFSGVLPLNPFVAFGIGKVEVPGVQAENLNKSVNLKLPFTSKFDVTEPIETSYERLLARNERPTTNSGDDDAIIRALESISTLSYVGEGGGLSSNASPPRRKRSMSLSHQEKSKRMFEHCASWEELEDTKENRLRLGGQAPVLTVRLGSEPNTQFVLSLRKIFIENGEATPFNQILSWLCQGRDYFTASSVALDLLRDVDALRDLQRITDSFEVAEERLNLEGLLDGIAPLNLGTESDSPSQQTSKRVTSTLIQLADMTVGCLVKGGLMMSETLEGFLDRNKDYDPARTTLMLAATATRSVSGNREVVRSVMGQAYQEKTSYFEQTMDLLWPVRCLLHVATSRNYLPAALLLLNEAMPDELRNRSPLEAENSASPPGLILCTSLVRLIIASDADAAGLLLDLIDEQSRERYWSSLEHETQLKLALIEIDGRCPLLREVEVRMWALKLVRRCIEAQASDNKGTSSNVIPSTFLKQLCAACLNNAGCKMEGLRSESLADGVDNDGVQKHLEEFRKTEEALAAAPGRGGLDYVLLIASLLLLEQRNESWSEEASVSTQSILDAGCYLAGRKETEEPAFAFDGPTVMKLCVISGNVSAGANLIGGRDGLVLKCCDILIKGAGMNMADAEAFLLDKGLSGDALKSKATRPNTDPEEPFTLTDGHRHVLWLLDEHVLSVKTYGEFESVHIRGKVDPVFAAQSCFRTWLRLHKHLNGTPWLVSWLRGRLGIDKDTVSGKRLACAALTRALVWRDESLDDNEIDSESVEVLATALGMEGKFLVQLAEACCGIVESVPPSLARGVLKSAPSSANDAASPVQVDV